ncbi:MAG: hypothetical protein GEU90_21555 [Gemmatimonas sp.]|nr:hypothetical protein [Gemmatimonas sp.]
MAERLVLDASAGVEILDRSFAGRRLSKDMDAAGASVWTVEHFRIEVAKVLRRDVLTRDLEDDEATRRVIELANWKLRVVRIGPLLVDAWSLRNTSRCTTLCMSCSLAGWAPPSSPETTSSREPPASRSTSGPSDSMSGN